MSAPKIWFIVGASSGLGHEIALQALHRGDLVIATARDSSKLSTLVSHGAKALDLDVSSPAEEIKRIVDEAYAVHGRIDVFLNCVGYLLEGVLEEASQEEFDRAINVNLRSTFTLVQALLPHLRAQGSGTIAALGSIAGWYSGAIWWMYSCVKFALAGLLLGLKDELEPFGIKVTVIEPGYFRTGFLDGRVKTERKMVEYEESLRPVMEFLEVRNGKQRGDPVKGAKVVVEALTGTGRAEGKELPGRLLVGADAVQVGLETGENEKRVIDEWRELTEGTDHEVQFE